MEPKLDRWIPCKNRSCTEVRYGTGEPILCNLCIEKRATELRAETERARAARFGTKRFTSLAATPDIPAGNADRDCQLTGAADACNHGAGVGLIAVGI